MRSAFDIDLYDHELEDEIRGRRAPRCGDGHPAWG